MLIFKIFLVISLLTHQVPYFASSYCAKSLVPALYVFGDSLVDVGNNNLLDTPTKANTFPYGIDFNNCSTGRFSNGKNFADILGEFMLDAKFIFENTSIYNYIICTITKMGFSIGCL